MNKGFATMIPCCREAWRAAVPPWSRSAGAALAPHALGLLLVSMMLGCQRPAGPIFPEVSPAIEWPPSPDQPRIRYVGELRGEAGLGIQASGWVAFQEVLGGPRAQVEFSRPSAIAVVGSCVFVADTGLGVVHRLDLEQRQFKVLRGAPGDPMRVPISMATGQGCLVVADRGRGALEIFDLNGEWRRTQRWPELTAPIAVVWDADRRWFWLADSNAHACWATSDLRTLGERVGGGGPGPGQFNRPTALAWSRSTGLVVADAMNFRVQLFDAAGTMVRSFGQKGDAAGDFSLPRAVATDSEGHLYVVDNQFENVQIFDREGRLLMAFGEGGPARGQFSLPSGIAIDEHDRIWVADSGNHRVQVFQYLPERKS